MNCNQCTHELDGAWAFCPLCGQKVILAQVDQSSLPPPPPPPPPSTPGQKLVELRSSLIQLSNSCAEDQPLRSRLAGIVAAVDEVIEGVEKLSPLNWRDNNSQLQIDLERELQKSREIKPNDEKGRHHITMKRPTGF